MRQMGTNRSTSSDSAARAIITREMGFMVKGRSVRWDPFRTTCPGMVTGAVVTVRLMRITFYYSSASTETVNAVSGTVLLAGDTRT
jgi:hypothetical protein